MNFSKNANIIRWFLIALSFIIVTAILWNTYDFFQKFKLEERNKMKIHSEALKSFAKDTENENRIALFKDIIKANKSISDKEKRELLNDAIQIFNKNAYTDDINLEILILGTNKNIPVILTTKNDSIKTVNNLDPLKEHDSTYLYQQLAIMKKQNNPIIFTYKVDNKNVTQKVYYRDSDLLTKLKYYPLALILILALFGSVIYLVFKSSRVAEQNKLWAGMAKETAHQIGTPLSSLLGWVEILRLNDTDESTVVEIEKDVNRLNTIADRFSKIGSIPKLEKINISHETKKTFDYLKDRSSKQIDFSYETDNSTVFVEANIQLFSWVIENVIKNAIDAMKGKGELKVAINSQGQQIKILISDTGKGIAKSQFKKVFETGFTTKKRGWGLGLSLAKRIIEDYHKGRIFVKKSTIGKGTTMAIYIKKLI
jgi:signal transduction histidine kinase